MVRKKYLPKRLLRLSLWLTGATIAVFGLVVALLAFPQLLLPNKAEAASVVVYYEGEVDPAVQQWADDTDLRLRAGGFGNPERPEHIYFFRDQGLYSFFTQLARVPTEVQGFAISILGTIGPRSWDRIHFEAGLLMEFLLDVRGYDLMTVLPDSVTREDTYAVMLEWHRGR